jgi:hypothetical protein
MDNFETPIKEKPTHYRIIFNDDGIPIGIGEAGTEITAEQWQEFLDNAGKRKWDGSDVVPYTAPFNADQCAQSIKSLAEQVILSIAPEHKQRNMLALSVEIADAKAQGTATEEQIAQSEDIRLAWAKIQAVRTKSDELEATYIAAGNDLTAEDLDTIKAALEAA